MRELGQVGIMASGDETEGTTPGLGSENAMPPTGTGEMGSAPDAATATGSGGAQGTSVSVPRFGGNVPVPGQLPHQGPPAPQVGSGVAVSKDLESKGTTFVFQVAYWLVRIAMNHGRMTLWPPFWLSY